MFWIILSNCIDKKSRPIYTVTPGHGTVANENTYMCLFYMHVISRKLHSITTIPRDSDRQAEGNSVDPYYRQSLQFRQTTRKSNGLTLTITTLKAYSVDDKILTFFLFSLENRI